jgi:hypothetical protein
MDKRDGLAFDCYLPPRDNKKKDGSRMIAYLIEFALNMPSNGNSIGRKEVEKTDILILYLFSWAFLSELHWNCSDTLNFGKPDSSRQ